MALRTPAALAALTLALALGATACGGGDGGDTDARGSATPSASTSLAPSATPSDLPTDTPIAPITPVAGLPTSFPAAAVPVLPGPVTQPIGEGSVDQGWVLELKLATKADDCFEAAATALVEHGFTQQPGETNLNGHREALFNSTTYAVIISTSTSDTGGCSLGYEVGKVSK
jgi:hypothetical protein